MHKKITSFSFLHIFESHPLDIIGLTALGLELEQLSSASTCTYSFHEAYHTIFEQSVTRQVITLINMYIPLRSWLPLKANRRFVEANNDLRRMLRQIIKERTNEIAERERTASKTVDGRDLLTFMIEERSDNWTDEEILGHVSCSYDSTYNLLIILVAAQFRRRRPRNHGRRSDLGHPLTLKQPIHPNPPAQRNPILSATFCVSRSRCHRIPSLPPQLRPRSPPNAQSLCPNTPRNSHYRHHRRRDNPRWHDNNDKSLHRAFPPTDLGADGV